MVSTCVVPAAAPPATPVPDAPFAQDVRVFLETGSLPELQLIDVLPGGEARLFGGGRWFRREGQTLLELEEFRSPDRERFTLAGPSGTPLTVSLPWAEVRQVWRNGPRLWLATSRTVHVVDGAGLQPLPLPGAPEIRQLATDPQGNLWAATTAGLRRWSGTEWLPVRVADQRWEAREVRGVAFDAQGVPWVALSGGVARGGGPEGNWRLLSGRDGVPIEEVVSVAAGPEGAVWFGTASGLLRWEHDEWHYRQGPRWVPGDDIRQLRIDGQGAVWTLTDRGPGLLERPAMTLWDKARHYEQEIERSLRRTEFGYLSEVGLEVPGDRRKIHYSDSDNDGLWTSMYGAGECFAYAATRRPEFAQRARAVFEALRFLQTVTQTGEIRPPPGYIARTIRPIEWPNPNEGRLEADRATRENGDRLWKVYEPRWPKSGDGRWYWKSDTSSDELDGHYFFHARYYDLVADEAERGRVREVVRALTDHFLAHDFRLVDHDGQPTRWGVFAPGDLNHNPAWWVERGINSLSMVSYLAVAEHMTGDPKYRQAAEELITRHGYGANIMNPKTQTGPGSGNQSDDEMAFMCFYNLMHYGRDARWLEKWRYAFHVYACQELPEMNPFFNFAYAAHGPGRVYRNPWGDFPLDPWQGWLEDSLSTLRGFPLDRVNWPHRNSHRADLRLLPPQQSVDGYEPIHAGRGYRTNGKVLPVAERHFNHWNTDPWRLDYGGDGRELASGTVFLLPYYMGLHHGFIAPPAP